MATGFANTSLHWSDILILVLYFLVVIGFGIWSSCQNRGSLGGYFLAGRNMNFVLVGASLFASNIGSGHFVGIAGSGADSGIAIAGFEVNAALALLMLGWLYAPVYVHAGVYTMPEFLKRRFGGERIRLLLAIIALLLSIFTKISVDLFAGGIFLEQALNWNIYVSVIFLVLLAALFTIGGGLTAVIWTDFVQTVIMIIGAFILMGIGFSRVGGLQDLKEVYPFAIANTTLLTKLQCGEVPPHYFSFMRPLDSDLSWISMFGLTISAMWYWCSDQVIVQRTLAAKNMDHVKGGCVLAGYIKLLPLFIMAIPGMMSRTLWPNEIGCSQSEICTAICSSSGGCNDVAFPLLVLRIMPHAIRGLMLAVMIAALMSSLTSIFNSSSTIFTVDIYQRIRKNAREWELMVVGRVFVLLLVVISILWIPVIQASQNSRLFDYIQSVTSFLAPPIAALYFFAIMSKRVNEEGGFWCLVTGFIIGLIRFGWEFSYTVPSCSSGLPNPMPAVVQLHYLNFGIVLFVLASIVLWAVSLLTKPIPMDCIHGLTFPDRFNDTPRISIPTASGFFKKADVYFDVKAALAKQQESLDKQGQSFESIPSLVDGRNSSVHSNDIDDVNDNKPSKPKLTFKSAIIEAGKWICGIEDQSGIMNENNVEVAIDTSINSDPFWGMVCDINALVLLSISLFFWFFFTDYSNEVILFTKVQDVQY
ncbi:hypothetical protein ACOME3_001422 [Neoechinorhynchus agilis]